MELAASPKVITVHLVVQTLTLLQACYSQCHDPKSLIIYNHENSVPGFNLLTNAEMGMCMMTCNKFELCSSVDWIREKRTCRLNTRFAIKNGTSLMTEGGIIHVDKESFPKHLPVYCPMHVCTEDAICLWGNCEPVLKEKVYKDCSDIVKRDPSKKGQNGVYVIYPDTGRREVFCDMTTDGGGWTIIQKRLDGEVDFYRTWIEYKNGFGNASKNYWIGNDAIHALTKNGNQTLRIELQRFNGEKAFAQYSTFSLGSEDTFYKLNVSGYSGTAGNSLAYHNNKRFATKDSEVVYSGRYCARGRHGAWWYYTCSYSNLNGKYGDVGEKGTEYMVWHHWTGGESLKESTMMIRETQ